MGMREMSLARARRLKMLKVLCVSNHEMITVPGVENLEKPNRIVYRYTQTHN